VWIGAWIRAATGPGSRESIDPERLAAAIAALPPLARDVFTLSSRGSLDYPAIAAALGISEDLVRRELAAALVAIDQTLTIQQRDNPSPIA
jgi:DNA-directed RNA polymerase specialized sigma24 family protein